MFTLLGTVIFCLLQVVSCESLLIVKPIQQLQPSMLSSSVPRRGNHNNDDIRTGHIFDVESATPIRRIRDHSSSSIRLRSELRGGANDYSESGSKNATSQRKPPSKCPVAPGNVIKFFDKNFFLSGMALAVWTAKTFPQWGVDGSPLRPEMVVGRYGVVGVFLVSGLSLKLSELKDAATRHYLNAVIQVTTFVAWPLLLGLPLAGFLRRFSPAGLFPPTLLDGVAILSTLPTTVNMCVLLTAAAGGNVATALCNAVLSNFMGILITPALLLKMFGADVQLPLLQMIGRLSNKVLVPVATGQLLRTAAPVRRFYEQNSKLFKRLQEIILIGIVWNAFSNAFSKGLGLDMKNAVALFFLLAGLHVAVLQGLFQLFRSPFVSSRLNLTKSEVVAATYCASHKTLAFGLPLIKTVFEGSPNMASYCAPIMLMHPLQLVFGSLLMPEYAWYLKEEDGERNV